MIRHIVMLYQQAHAEGGDNATNLSRAKALR